MLAGLFQHNRPIAVISAQCFCPPMKSIKTAELRTLVDWIVSEAEARWGDDLPLDQDFYKAPSFGSVFRDEDQPQSLGYGSLADEIEFSRTSVLAGGGDLLDIVAERVGYLLLAVADTVERERDA